MPDPDNPIFFPELNGVDGSTCGVYAFGFTSGCTDDNGIGRGFTQEWYYDGDIGAWVSVTVGVTSGGGADFTNAGAPYTAQNHAAPLMTGTGLAKKYAYLDPTTGSLTFGYINTFEIINPSENEFSVNDVRWDGVSKFSHTQSADLAGRGYPSGITLAGDTDHVFQYSDPTDSSSTAFRFYINRRRNITDGNTLPSPFATLPVNADEEIKIQPVADNDNFTLATFTGVGNNELIAQDVGKTAFAGYFSGNSGEVLLNQAEVGIGFTTAGGPTKQSFEVRLAAKNPPGAGALAAITPVGTRVVRHENWIYVLGSTYSTGISGTDSGLFIGDFIDGTKGASGKKILLRPNDADNNMSNHSNLAERVNITDFGVDSTGNGVTDAYVWVAIPTRVNLNADSHLYQNAGIGANGFVESTSDPEFHFTAGVTNEKDYYEIYDFYRSVQQNGPNVQNGFKIDNR